jgi:hypothetical protein
LKGKINKQELLKIQRAIANKALSPEKTEIIAVTKNQPYAAITSAFKNQIYNIGENRVQELEKKIKEKEIPETVKIHFIGKLQKNKAKKAVLLCDYIQSVDSIELAKEINKQAKKIKKKQKIYLQINIGKDIKKTGFKKKQVKEAVKEILDLLNVEIVGLMTILPQGLTAKQNRELYKKTFKIKEHLNSALLPRCSFLSMGMSGDYKEALKEGATQIRIGTKLYG